MQLIDTVFCTEIKERSVLENRLQVFYATLSFDIALRAPTSWLLSQEQHRKDKKRGKCITFQQELSGILQS